MNYGIELEFFVLDKNDKVVPAYKATTDLDGNPVIGEIKTDVFPNIVDAIFDLEKKFYLQEEKLKAKGYKILVTPEVKVDDDFLKDLRKSKLYVDRKQLEVLDEQSIYKEGSTGKLLPRGLYKASLQLNISENTEVKHTYRDKDNVPQTFTKSVSNVFDYYKIIKKLDTEFAEQIAETKRVKGIYAMKDGKLGTRIEYRSLPNSIHPRRLLNILK